ncbi:NADPH-glutathione reductase [Fulvimarina manganoxydans]|uniref:Glutathione reductase n=1 Tax=Fulvimarina manganoxydans TaxID=937218 RepID=A0A1W1YCX5_9HYPH|nr:glutathione-disulfide reductase [Fulvimarina manganoxydans]MEE2952747.1 glutathione-disulfide reductase [Pseudomonadota bacterium]SMC33608.1 NADPH-glutathione reductase [Fulvimarina manganoxydans]
MASYDYDLFVIGGGSGGVRAARRASMLGKRVAIAEEYRYGGTCVIRGCVPKKLMVYASQFSEAFEDAAGFGWSVGPREFHWDKLIAAKDHEIDRLEKVYRANIEKAGAEILNDRATFEGPHEIRLENTGKIVTAETILIATGGRPNQHAALPGAEHCLTSNEVFHLTRQPRKLVILGGGYIAVEFANIFLGLGSDVTLVYRGQEILQGFDDDLRHELHQAMAKKGMSVRCKETFKEVRQKADGRFEVHLDSGEVLDADEALLAIGRQANTVNLGCEKAGVELDSRGAVVVDDYSRSNVPHIFAIGDVTHRVQLTPVAIHEAMCLVETVFKNNPTKPDYDTIPTAVFSQPEIGTVGLTEAKAAQTYDEIAVYLAKFKPMKNTLSGRDDRMMMKIIAETGTDKVVGVHILGPDAGELSQVLGIAVKAGLTKAQFDATMAVHPTAAEELVTMYEPSYIIRAGERIAA